MMLMLWAHWPYFSMNRDFHNSSQEIGVTMTGRLEHVKVITYLNIQFALGLHR